MLFPVYCYRFYDPFFLIFIITRNDWYQAQANIATDTLKVMIDKHRIIRSSAFDVSTLFPVDCAVFEVPADKVPVDFDNNAQWMLTENGHIIARVYSHEEQVAAAEAEKTERLHSASVAMGPLQDAVDLAMASDKEKAQLLAWKKYRILLNRVETDSAPDIDWPSSPAP